jgi:hypothetical protein
MKVIASSSFCRFARSVFLLVLTASGKRKFSPVFPSFRSQNVNEKPNFGHRSEEIRVASKIDRPAGRRAEKRTKKG